MNQLYRLLQLRPPVLTRTGQVMVIVVCLIFAAAVVVRPALLVSLLFVAVALFAARLVAVFIWPSSGRPASPRLYRSVALAIAATNLISICAVMQLPLWTPPHDSVHLFTGLATIGWCPAILILPLLSLVSLTLALRPNQSSSAARLRQVAASVVYAAALLGINLAFFNQAADSPNPSTVALCAVLLTPFIQIALALMALIRIRTKAEARRDAARLDQLVAALNAPRPHPIPARPRSATPVVRQQYTPAWLDQLDDLPKTKGPSPELSPNPITGLYRAALLFRRAPLTVGVIGVVYVAVQAGILGLQRTSGVKQYLLLSPWAAMLLMLPPLLAGFMLWAAASRLAQDRPAPLVETALYGLRRSWALLAALIIAGIGVAAGLTILIAPGVYLLLHLALVPVFIIRDGLGPIRALRRSYTVTYGNATSIAGFFGINMLASAVIFPLTLYRSLAGDIAASLIGAILTFAEFGFLQTLAERIEAAQHAGYSYLRPHRANLWLIAALVAIPVAASVVFVVLLAPRDTSFSNNLRTVDTPCYKLGLPSDFSTRVTGQCTVVATHAGHSITYLPLTSSAATSAQLGREQVASQFPRDRFRVTKVVSVTIGGEDANAYTVLDARADTIGLVYFIHRREQSLAGTWLVNNFEIADVHGVRDWSSYVAPVDLTKNVSWTSVADSGGRPAAALTQAAGIAYSHGDYAGTVAYARKAVAADGTNAQAYDLLALGLYNTGQYDQARIYIEKAVALEPGAAGYTEDLHLIQNPPTL